MKRGSNSNKNTTSRNVIIQLAMHHYSLEGISCHEIFLIKKTCLTLILLPRNIGGEMK